MEYNEHEHHYCLNGEMAQDLFPKLSTANMKIQIFIWSVFSHTSDLCLS